MPKTPPRSAVAAALATPTVVLAFDDSASDDELRRWLLSVRPGRLRLFPLTSRQEAIDRVESLCRKHCAAVEILDSASAVQEAAKKLRRPICKWLASLSLARSGSVRLRDAFLQRKRHLSTWWMTPIAERSPLLTDYFLRLSQAAALREAALADPSCHLKIVARPRLESWLEACANPDGPALRRGGETGFLLSVVPLLGKAVARSAFLSLQALWRARIAARRLNGSPRTASGGVLLVSYFPAFVSDGKEPHSRYFGPLEAYLERANVTPTRLLLYAPLNGHSYSTAVSAAARARDPQRTLSPVEHEITVGIVIMAWAAWIRHVVQALRLIRNMATGSFAVSPPVAQCERPMARALARELFRGRVFSALLLHETFTSFLRWRQPQVIIYPAEFHAWEVALAAARDRACATARLIGFQHTSFSPNLLNYFHENREYGNSDDPARMPFPDVVACNGPVFSRMLREGGIDRVAEVEALRHIDDADSIDKDQQTDALSVLVIGSISRRETEASLRMAGEARSLAPEWQFRVRLHPAMQASVALPAGLTATDPGTGLRQLLKESRAVIVGASTVAIEALIAGCAVIIPVFSDELLLSPAESVCGETMTASSGEEIAAMLRHVCFRTRKAIAFSQVWRSDPSLSAWKTLLTKTLGPL